MDHWLENLAQWAQETLHRSGRPLFLAGVWLFLLGLVGWMFLVVRRRFLRRAKAMTADLSATDPRRLAEQILEISGKPSAILMASERYESLSVTIPVQTAMELARRKQRCLLIDLDLQRNSISRVFDLDSFASEDPMRPLQTPFKDFHIWPAANFDPARPIPVQKIIAAAATMYDVVLIYAPHLRDSSILQSAAAACQVVLLFHPPGAFSEDLRLQLQRTGAVLIDIPSSVSAFHSQAAAVSASKNKIVEQPVSGQNETANREMTVAGKIENPA